MTHPPKSQGPGQDRIEAEAYAYVMGGMSPAARRAFERRLETDPYAGRSVKAWRKALDCAGEWMAGPVPGRERAASIPIPSVAGRTAARGGSPLRELIRIFTAPASAPWGRRAGGWSLAAAGAFAVAFMIYGRVREQAPVGRLDYAAGAVQVSGPESTEKHTGGGSWDLRRDSVLHTPPEGKGIFRVGGGIQGAMAEATVVSIVNDGHVALDRGAVWFWVKPEAAERGFSIRTPQGPVWLSGRTFGVRSIEGGSVIEAAEGAVLARAADGRETVIAAGNEASVTGLGIGEPKPRKGGASPPGWVSQLMDEWRRNRAAGFLPSLGGGAAGGEKP